MTLIEPMAFNLLGTAGLTSVEANARRAADGPNALPKAAKRSLWKIAFGVVREPMLALLLSAGGIYLLLGELTDALVLMAFAIFTIALTIIQETRTEHSLDALRDLSAPRALVIRDGASVHIAGADVVRGDVLILAQGDRVAADATLLEADDFQVDESLLTGESLPVRKLAGTVAGSLPAPQPGGEDQPTVYSGTLVTRGSGTARVLAIGQASAIGKIGHSLTGLDTEAPRLRHEINGIVRLGAFGGGSVALVVVLLYATLRGGWIDAVLAGIAIGMSLLPEEFPVVLTIFLAMGAWRIARVGVLTRRASAIETLGSATILCTDKTGTLTENRMAVAALWSPTGEVAAVEQSGNIPSAFRAILDTSILASASVPVDPMEIAFHEAGRGSASTDRAGWTLEHSYALRPDLMAMSNVWRTADAGAPLRIAAKGAPEAVAGLCRLSQAEQDRLASAVDAMANKGIRVLGVATATTDDRAWKGSQSDYAFTLVGLIGLADPLRASVPAAVKECQDAGIRVVMITGDHAATARSIALQAGIANGEVLTGIDVAALDDAALAARLKKVSVFARILPEQKLRIVSAFKTEGEIVAMTGDGVNDAPSLKAANIGIAMGKRGTDVAREAAAIVLLDDDFGSIVKAIGLGRRIYDNMRKVMGFIFAVHVPLAGLAVLPLALGLPILFGPIHIALLQMIIDPVCALVFEAEREEANIMDRQPRDPAERLFSWRMIAWSVFQGALALAMLTTIFLVATRLGMAEAEVRALTFFALILSSLALILVNRTSTASLVQAFARKNAALGYVFGAVAGISMIVLLVPAARQPLKFGPLHVPDLAIAGACAVLLLVILEMLKPLVRQRPLGLDASGVTSLLHAEPGR